MDIRVRRRIPSTEAALPICTLCQDRDPPDWVGSADDFQAFLQALNDPKNPKHQDCLTQAGLDWIIPDSAEDITRRLHLIDYYR